MAARDDRDVQRGGADLKHKVDVLRAIRRVERDDLHKSVVRGQYGPGSIGGKRVPGYREEQGVNPRSATETFAALKLYIDNWRWQDVPFYLRTGKHLPGQYRIEVVDLLLHPQLAKGDEIVAIPTLVRKLPSPIRKVIGDLSNTERALVGLQLRPAAHPRAEPVRE